MATVSTYPHIDSPEGESPRLTRLPRVRVAQIIMDHLAHGWSAEEVCRQYPHLTPAEVYAAFTYYFDHRQEIDKEIEAEWREAERIAGKPHSSPFFRRLHSQRRS